MNGRPLTGRLGRASDDLPMPSAYFKFVLEQLGTTRALREAILEGTGVNPANVASLGEEITLGQQLRQARNVNAVAPPGWGLALGARLGSATHGVLGFGAVSAPTLRDTIELPFRDGHARDPSFGFQLRNVGREVRIEIRERIDLLEEERAPLIETFLLSVQALVESIIGRKLEGTKVEVSAQPAHADLYRRYFSGTVSFGSEVSALVVPESWLDHPSPFADPALQRVSVLSLEAMAERLKGRRYTAALVEELMASGGQGGRPLEEVARRTHDDAGYSHVAEQRARVATRLVVRKDVAQPGAASGDKPSLTFADGFRSEDVRRRSSQDAPLHPAADTRTSRRTRRRSNAV